MVIGFTVDSKGGGTLFLTFSGTTDRMSNFYEMTIAELKIRLSVDRAFKMLQENLLNIVHFFIST